MKITNIKNALNGKMEINTVALIVFFILIVGGAFVWFKVSNARLVKAKAETQAEIKLRNALIADFNYYKNKNNEIVAEKLTLQATVKELTGINSQLSANQQELLKRVKSIEKSNTIIAAALIETKISLDSLRAGNIFVDTTKNEIRVNDSTKDIKYDFLIGKVKPISPGVKPTFKIKELTFTNTQFVEFHWGVKKEGYPISFSISNSNKYFKTTNIDSYAIPELNKTVIKPTGWQKFTSFFGKSTNVFMTFSIGFGAGVATLLLLK